MSLREAPPSGELSTIKLNRVLSLIIIVSSPLPLVGEGVGCVVGNLVGIGVGFVVGGGTVGLLVGGFVFGSGKIGDGGKEGAEGVEAFLFSFLKNTNSVVKAPASNASTTMAKMMKKVIDLLDFRRSDSSIKESTCVISSDWSSECCPDCIDIGKLLLLPRLLLSSLEVD